MPAAPERFKQLGEKVFGDNDLLGATRIWLENIGMNLRLCDMGVNREQLSQIAGTVQKTAGWVIEHPRGMIVNDIINIYQSAF